jgi:glycosyltransferase involved in cell wall biosynthesis
MPPTGSSRSAYADDRHVRPGLGPRLADAEAGASAKRRRWTINGDFVALRQTGVARYAREVTLALDTLVAEAHPLARDLDLRIVAPTAGCEPLALRAIAFEVVPEFRRPRLPQVWVQLQLPRHVRGGLLSFCNLAPVAVSRQIVCIHDLQTRLVPESYGRAFRLAHDVILPLLGRRVARVTTVSNFSRDNLIKANIAPAEKITVTYNGSDHARHWDADRSRVVPAARPYALAAWRNQWHKSPGLLVKLAPLLDELGLDLTLFGEADEGMVAQHAEARPPNLRLLGRISDDDLRRALENAVCFLFPSRMEGFGLPAVEAMACDCPVVCAPMPSLPEICGAAALYADPDDPQAWAAQVARLVTDQALRQMQIENGRVRAAAYSWRRIATCYLELMAQVDRESPRPPLPRPDVP